MGLDDPPDKPPNLNEPRFLVIKRKDNQSMANVSPFLIKKQIDFTCNGEVIFAKKTRDGNLLVKTKTGLQAFKLLRLKIMGDLEIEVVEHLTLNTTKGVIYSNDLRPLTEEEIKKELKAQNICDVKKIKKKLNEVLVDTGLVILTFASVSTPENIKIGYESVKVRAYIPPPLRCNNCFRFGHISNACRNSKLCINCASDFHTNPDSDKTCSFDKNCVNCKDAKLPDSNHSSIYRGCPIFVKQQEIQAIKTLEKVDVKKAISIYNSRHAHDGPMYSSVVKTNLANNYIKKDNPTNHVITQKSDSSPSTSKDAARKIITYNDITSQNTTSEIKSPTITPLNSPIKIFPKNLSNRAKTLLKAKEKKQVNTLKKNLPSDALTRFHKTNDVNFLDVDMSPDDSDVDT